MRKKNNKERQSSLLVQPVESGEKLDSNSSGASKVIRLKRVLPWLPTSNLHSRERDREVVMMAGSSRSHAILSTFVTVHPHETSALIHSSSCFFFVLSAYFVVLPLRDEGAISLGLSNLPGLFIGSLVLTLIAAPLSTLVFSLPKLSKHTALVLIHRFFSLSLVAFFVLWQSSSVRLSQSNLKGSVVMSSTPKGNITHNVNQVSSSSMGENDLGWFYISVRMGFFLWVALLNLITISSTWARIIDVMDNEAGSRLFGFIGAGATLGQLFGSLFATLMAWLGPYLLLLAALLLELAAQLSKGINQELPHLPEEISPIRQAELDEQEVDGETAPAGKNSSPAFPSASKPRLWVILDGFSLILSSTYLLYVSLFLWLSAVVSSFFYFQKVTVIAMAVTNSTDRRRLFAQINSFIAIFILAGQLTLTGCILSFAGITIALCSSPLVAILNLVFVAFWPTWVAVAISETVRKVVTYVVTRPGRELLFTVVSQEEKYKAKLCIDVVVQRIGDATAAGMFKLLFSSFNGKISAVSLYALPVSLMWIITAFHLGHRQVQLARQRSVNIG